MLFLGFFFFNNLELLFWNSLRLARSCKNSPESSCVIFRQLCPGMIDCITIPHEQNRDSNSVQVLSAQVQALFELCQFSPLTLIFKRNSCRLQKKSLNGWLSLEESLRRMKSWILCALFQAAFRAAHITCPKWNPNPPCKVWGDNRGPRALRLCGGIPPLVPLSVLTLLSPQALVALYSPTSPYFENFHTALRIALDLLRNRFKISFVS